VTWQLVSHRETGRGRRRDVDKTEVVVTFTSRTWT
jgi:hypothetical protein